MDSHQTPAKKKKIEKGNGKDIKKFTKKRSQPLILSLKNPKSADIEEVKDMD